MLVQLLVPAAFALFAFGLAATLPRPPPDRERLREHFRIRGREVLSIRRVGTDFRWSNRYLPIRKYELVTRGPSGERSTLVIGVGPAALIGGPTLWLYDQAGDRRGMF